MLLLNGEDVARLVDLDLLVDRISIALEELSRGRADMPPRSAANVADRDAFLGVMPAYLPSSRALTTKLVTSFPHNLDRPTHQALVVCFEGDTGAPTAVMDGTLLTELRTAAASALATRLLARDGASEVAVLGTGAQARAHARAVARVLPIQRLRIAGRDAAKAEALAAELAGELQLEVAAAPDYRAATESADVVCACTHSPDPVVRREWLAPGTHVNSVGFNTAGYEVDADTVARSVVVVESRASALAAPPAGSNDLVAPLRDGKIDEADVVEIGELVAGTRRGRTSAEEITLYKSVGVAVEDAAAAALILEAATARGAGSAVEL